jgi:hypothetical protein
MDDKRLDELADYYGERDISEEIEAAELERHEPDPRDRVMIVSSVRLPKHTMDRVREAAMDQGVKPTALMRRWIEERLDLWEQDPSPEPDHLDLLSQVMHRVVREELEDAGLRGG